jgi:serine/threonine-protein kinase
MEPSMRAGMVVDNRFRLEKEVGSGATCAVWAARDSTTGKRVAVKLLALHERHDPALVRRFRRESATLLRCDCPCIVRALEAGEDAHFGPYLVMELLAGETLEQRLRRVAVLSAHEFLEVARDVVSALECLHGQGIVHRDLKPANVFLWRDETGRIRAKLLDFGTVKPKSPDQFGRTANGALVGTLSRMSPEQAHSAQVDHKTDVWAFAMIAFEALVGSPAIDGTMPAGQVILTICFGRLPVPSHLNASIPLGFDAWFARSTMAKAAQRFSTVREQWTALVSVLARQRGVLDAQTIPMPAPTFRMSVPPMKPLGSVRILMSPPKPKGSV